MVCCAFSFTVHFPLLSQHHHLFRCDPHQATTTTDKCANLRQAQSLTSLDPHASVHDQLSGSWSLLATRQWWIRWLLCTAMVLGICTLDVKTTMGWRWVYTVKVRPDGKIDRLKTCLVAKGHTHIFDLDYDDTFSLVV